MSSTSTRILVVDDDDQVRAVAVRQLSSLGYGVVQAANGRAALDALAAAPDVDLIFVDMIMPGGLSGPEVAREARRRRPQLKILFASGHFADAGADIDADSIIKPYSKKELAAKVQQVLAKPAG